MEIDSWWQVRRSFPCVQEEFGELDAVIHVVRTARPFPGGDAVPASTSSSHPALQTWLVAKITNHRFSQYQKNEFISHDYLKCLSNWDVWPHHHRIMWISVVQVISTRQIVQHMSRRDVWLLVLSKLTFRQTRSRRPLRGWNWLGHHTGSHNHNWANCPDCTPWPQNMPRRLRKWHDQMRPPDNLKSTKQILTLSKEAAQQSIYFIAVH